MNKLNQRGFSLIDTFIVVLVVALLAVIGLKVHSAGNSQASTQPSTTTTTPTSKESTSAATIPAVNSKTDLDKMSKALDDNDTTSANSSDDSALSAQSNDF